MTDVDNIVDGIEQNMVDGTEDDIDVRIAEQELGAMEDVHTEAVEKKPKKKSKKKSKKKDVKKKANQTRDLPKEAEPEVEDVVEEKKINVFVTSDEWMQKVGKILLGNGFSKHTIVARAIVASGTNKTKLDFDMTKDVLDLIEDIWA
jgi:TPP-dependent indolepyruvate ferredoxin oxidoreductase alpha subunit